jgi:hypothetical protein
MGAQTVPNIVFLLAGSALILAGIFGLMEILIRLKRRNLDFAFELPTSGMSEPEMDAPALALSEEDLELVVVRDRETNPDGRLRQDIIRELQIGDPVALVPEAWETGSGREDIRVDTMEGTIGYVPRNKVPFVLEVLTAGSETRMEISQIGHAGKVSGVWISLSTGR